MKNHCVALWVRALKHQYELTFRKNVKPLTGITPYYNQAIRRDIFDYVEKKYLCEGRYIARPSANIFIPKFKI
jgi:hypothetical protein